MVHYMDRPGHNCKDTPPPLSLFPLPYIPQDYDEPWDKDVHFVTSHDSFKTFSSQVFCGNMFEVIGKRCVRCGTLAD